MSYQKLRYVMASLGTALLYGASPVWAQSNAEPTRMVVRFKPVVQAMSAAAQVDYQAARVSALAAKAAGALAPVRTLASGAVVYSVTSAMTPSQAQSLAMQLASDSSVMSAEPDVRVHALAAATDPWFAQQWPLAAPTSTVGASNFAAAWGLSTGAGVNVAVLDTGTVAHPEMVGKELPGYDFVSDAAMAGDGGGRDADPTDAGDYCGTSASSSSWHGTAVSSLIAAKQNNGAGISGAAPGATITHVRVLGRCGGWLSDAADAIYWLAGKSFAGIPAVSTAPRVINLSMGGPSSCYQYMQEAVSAAVSKGIVIVAAAGNEGSATIHAPSNCAGVIAVGAHTASGDLASYSNYSAEVALTAPGGGACKTQTGTACVASYPLASAVLGSTVFTGYGDVRYFNGTSAATPHVAAAAALLLAANPSMTPAQVRSALLTSSRAHPAGTFCSTPGRCGSGMLDANAALGGNAAPLVTIAYGSNITAGTTTGVLQGLIPRNVTGTLVASASGLAPFTYAWKQLSGTAVAGMSGASTSTLSFTTPATSGAMQFEVAVTSAAGVTARNTISIRANNAPAAPTGSLIGARLGQAFAATLPTTDADGDTLTYALVQGPAGLTISGGGKVSWPQPVAGTSLLTVSAQDPYGQKSTGQISIAVLSNSAPVVSTLSFSATANVGFATTVRASDADGDAVTFSATGQPSGLTLSSTGAMAWAKPVVGSYSFTVVAKDSKGATSQARVALGVAAANRAPSAVAAKIGGTATVALSYQLVATDPDGDSVSFAVLSGAPSGLTVSPSGLLAWASPVKGTYSIRISAKDSKGLATAGAATLTIAPLNHAPTVSGGTVTGISGVALSYKVLATDSDGDKLTYSLRGAPGTASITAAGVLMWSKPTVGTFSVTVTVKDPAGLTASAPLALAITQANRAPVLAAVSASASTVSSFSAVVRGTDPDGDALSYSLGAGAPAGLALSPSGSLSWAVPVKGAYSVALVARDARGLTATAKLSLTVTAPNRAPVVKASASVSSTKGAVSVIKISATDPDGDPLTYSFKQSAPGMALSSAGMISWRPASTGAWPVTIVVKDRAGLTAEVSFNVTAVR